MDSSDDFSCLLSLVLDDRLRSQIQGIDLTSLSRIPSERLAKTALPNVQCVELVPGPVYAKHYDELYRTNFHGGERERSDLIVSRHIDGSLKQRAGLALFRIIGIRNPAGRAIGAAHFFVLFLENCGPAVLYLQYIYIRPENPRQDLGELLHTLVLVVAIALASVRTVRDAIEISFTLCETELAFQADGGSMQGHAVDRSKIHSRSGSKALMLRRKSDGRVLSAHVRPGLEINEPPLTYKWALRAKPPSKLAFEKSMWRSLISAYY